MEIRLDSTIELLLRCFEQATALVNWHLKSPFRNTNEETITVLLHLALYQTMKRASVRGSFTAALLKDLRKIVPHPETSLKKEEFVARVSWHPRHTETKTGGDFALQFIYPRLMSHQDGTAEIQCDKNYRGLLIQAKKVQGKKWGTLTKRQRKLYPKIRNFFALVFYANRKATEGLLPLKWLLCKSKRRSRLIKSLKNGGFKNCKTSAFVFKNFRTFLGEIGTSDRNLIAKYIEPLNTPSLTICIERKKPGPPGEVIKIMDKYRVDVKEKPTVKVGVRTL